MRIALVTDAIGMSGAGVAAVVHNLALALAARDGCEILVMARDAGRACSALRPASSIQFREFRVVGPERIGFSPDLAELLLDCQPDLVHLHGIWRLTMCAVSIWSRRSGNRPYVVSPHGMLNRLALQRSWLLKRAAAWAYTDAFLKGAAALHALCRQEADALRAYGLRNTVIMIPNGVWLRDPDAPGVWPRHTIADHLAAPRRVLYLGRFDPNKNLLALLEAWKQLISHGCDRGWRLRLVGWGNRSYLNSLTAYIRRYDMGQSIEIAGPAFGADKDLEFDQADLFVMPSLSEGIPLAVLEAWSSGLFVILSPFCNLDAGLRSGCAAPCGTDSVSIRNALVKAMQMSPSELQAAGERGRSLVAHQFSWQTITARFFDVYAGLV